VLFPVSNWNQELNVNSVTLFLLPAVTPFFKRVESGVERRLYLYISRFHAPAGAFRCHVRSWSVKYPVQ